MTKSFAAEAINPCASPPEHRVYEPYPERHGMVIMQRLFMRREMLAYIHEITGTAEDA